MAVRTQWAMQIETQETLTSGVPALTATGAGSSLIHNGYNAGGTIHATSSVPATKCWYGTATLSAGALTLDLTALATGTQGTVDLTGLKVQVMTIRNPSAALITLTEGAANGYEILGNTWKTGLLSGQRVMIFGNEATPDVGSSTKNIDITGTGTQYLEIGIVAG